MIQLPAAQLYMAKAFGAAHFIFLACYIIISAASFYYVIKYCTTSHQKRLAVLISAGVLLAAITANRISISVVSGKAIDLLPSSICGFTSFALAVCALLIKDKNFAFFHCLIYVAIVGGAIATIYPDYLPQAPTIFHSRTITGLIHHCLSMNLGIILILTGFTKPELKKWYYLPLGLCVYMTLGLILNQATSLDNAMNQGKPFVADTILTWYFVGTLLCLLVLAFLIIYEFIKKKQRK